MEKRRPFAKGGPTTLNPIAEREGVDWLTFRKVSDNVPILVEDAFYNRFIKVYLFLAILKMMSDGIP